MQLFIRFDLLCCHPCLTVSARTLHKRRKAQEEKSLQRESTSYLARFFEMSMAATDKLVLSRDDGRVLETTAGGVFAEDEDLSKKVAGVFFSMMQDAGALLRLSGDATGFEALSGELYREWPLFVAYLLSLCSSICESFVHGIDSWLHHYCCTTGRVHKECYH
jgi:hypothetical protein